MSSLLNQNSSFDRVPPDLWRVIFGMCVAEDTKASVAFQRRKAPLLLCQICSAWRTIAIETPELWCNIELRVNQRGLGLPRNELVVKALARAGGIPLTLAIRGANAKKGSDQDTLFHAADTVVLLLSNLSRARDLELDIQVLDHVFLSRDHAIDHPGGRQQLQTILDKSKGAPLLERLKIFGHRGFADFISPGSFTDSTISRMWTPSPKLHTLILQGHAPFRNSPVTDIIQTHSTHLTILEVQFAMQTNEFLAVLSAAKNLVQCTVKKLDGRLPPDGRLENPIVLPFLKYLDITGSGRLDESPPLTQFLEYIQTPSLVFLHLRKDRRWSRPSFLTFLQNSSCSILHLSLDIEDSEETEKIECLRLLPHLETLDMHGDRYRDMCEPDCFTEILANALKDWDSLKQEFVICPHLERLKVDYDFIDEHADKTTEFADMVEKRFRAGPFRCVSVLRVENLDSRSMAYGAVFFEILRLLILRRDGLTVELHPEPSWSVVLR